jgi:hypothetical protein
MNTLARDLVTVDRSYLEWSTLSAEEHVRESLGKPIKLPEELEELLNGDYVTQHEEQVLAWLEELTGVPYEQVHRDNTYNYEQDLDSSLLWSVFAPVDCSDWIWAHDVFVAVAIHQGGDVRGNYGPDRLYRVDSLGETGFLDVVLSWWLDPIRDREQYERELDNLNQRLDRGYSGYPYGELEKMLAAGSKPAYCTKRQAWMVKVDGIDVPCTITPQAPYYGG